MRLLQKLGGFWRWYTNYKPMTDAEFYEAFFWTRLFPPALVFYCYPRTSLTLSVLSLLTIGGGHVKEWATKRSEIQVEDPKEFVDD
jgi:hypothetical protein